MPRRAGRNGGEGGEGLCGRLEARDALTPPQDPSEGRIVRMSARERRGTRRAAALQVEEEVIDGSPVTPTKRSLVCAASTPEKRAKDAGNAEPLPIGYVSDLSSVSSVSSKALRDWKIDAIMFGKPYEHAGKLSEEMLGMAGLI